MDLIFRSPPVSIRWKEETEDWSRMKKQVSKEGLDSAFEGYFESIRFLDEAEFRDGLHLTDRYLKANINHLRTID